MTPAQLLARIQRHAVPPAVLLLGPEAYQRRRIQEALFASVPAAAAADGITRHDMSELSLAEIVDDARALSLFASERIIWIANAEAALPRGRAAADDEGGDEGLTSGGGGAVLENYLKDPTPGIVMVFEAVRFDFEGDDKRRQDRVRKFYAAIPDAVELRRFSAPEARREAESLARASGFAIDPAALDLLVEALGADIARIAVEIEKLSLYAAGRAVGVDDIAALVPDARATNIFALVNALGLRDRGRALEILNTLVQEGEYLPLALAFLSTQFRMALAAGEAGLTSASQVQQYFARLGVPMWGSRAEQVHQTLAKFGPAQIERALQLIFRADTGLRDARPDDRIVMERFILQLVG